MKALEGGKPNDAIKLFAKVRKSWSDDADIGYLEGLAYGKLGDLKSVIRVSNRALKLDPNHYGALCNLANAQMGSGVSEDALENYAKSIEINPNAPEILNNYGRALSILGRREESIQQYEKALAVNPGHAPVYCAGPGCRLELGIPVWEDDPMYKICTNPNPNYSLTVYIVPCTNDLRRLTYSTFSVSMNLRGVYSHTCEGHPFFFGGGQTG